MAARTSRLLLLLVASMSLAAWANAQTPTIVLIKAGRLLDVKSGQELTNQEILIEGERIKEVGPDSTVGPHASKNVRVIDLSNATVLPGLIDCHTHLLQNYDGALGEDDPNMVLTVAGLSPAKRALLGAKMGREDLEAGITTVRDVGNSGLNGDVALRDAINAGWVVGPRILASTRALAAAGGQFGPLQTGAQNLIEQEYAVVSGVEEARRAVRQAFYDGADQIKVIVNTGPRVLSVDEMKVIVEEAHRVHKKVAAHAIGDLATRVAADAGVDSIEHGYVVPDDALAMMAAKKIYLVPTDYPWEFYYSILKSGNSTPEQQQKEEALYKQIADSNERRLARALKAGVPIAAGSDEYYQEPGKTRGESSVAIYRAYIASGMAPIDVIRAATVNAADLLGWQDRVGTIEPGKFADIIAVDGDPLKDITQLQHASFVMKGGAVIKSPPTMP
jgi:imidazolonepropionase-like amidohydrolase